MKKGKKIDLISDKATRAIANQGRRTALIGVTICTVLLVIPLSLCLYAMTVLFNIAIFLLTETKGDIFSMMTAFELMATYPSSILLYIIYILIGLLLLIAAFGTVRSILY